MTKIKAGYVYREKTPDLTYPFALIYILRIWDNKVQVRFLDYGECIYVFDINTTRNWIEGKKSNLISLLVEEND